MALANYRAFLTSLFWSLRVYSIVYVYKYAHLKSCMLRLNFVSGLDLAPVTYWSDSTRRSGPCVQLRYKLYKPDYLTYSIFMSHVQCKRSGSLKETLTSWNRVKSVQNRRIFLRGSNTRQSAATAARAHSEQITACWSDEPSFTCWPMHAGTA